MGRDVNDTGFDVSLHVYFRDGAHEAYQKNPRHLEFIEKMKATAHKTCMLSAFVVSSFFLVSYLLHHYQVGSVPFLGRGWQRNVYFALLIPHVVLAACVVPLALTTIHRGWKSRLEQHVRIARWTLPIWLYVSVSGVLIYWMLYHLEP